MSEKIIVTFGDGSKEEYANGTTLFDIARKKQDMHDTIVAAKVNWGLRELTYELREDALVEFIDLNCQDGIRIYQRGLIFVLIKAARDLFPDRQLWVEHSLGRGIYCELHGNKELTKDEVKQIKHRMKEIIEMDLPIGKVEMSKKEAEAIFNRNREYGKVNLLRYRQEEKLNMYVLDDYKNYFYGYMVPRTGMLKNFDLKFYLPGLVLLTPTVEFPDQHAEFVEQKKLFSIFRRYEQWGEIIGIGEVAELNESIETGRVHELIRVAEADHEKRISRIADEILSKKEEARIILIAGPSSSGKTTFANRLSTHLRINGLKPVAISLDDYFVDREFTPRDENGEYDFENIDAIDIELFNDHLISLIQGYEVEVPHFNFKTGKRERGRLLRLKKDNPIIIEGIHGLNDKLTQDIPNENKYKIYISALTQLNVDQHNRIPTTDNRLIRRMVRDNKYRNHDAQTTLRLWPSVRRGRRSTSSPIKRKRILCSIQH